MFQSAPWQKVDMDLSISVAIRRNSLARLRKVVNFEVHWRIDLLIFVRDYHYVPCLEPVFFCPLHPCDLQATMSTLTAAFVYHPSESSEFLQAACRCWIWISDEDPARILVGLQSRISHKLSQIDAINATIVLSATHHVSFQVCVPQIDGQ